MDDPQSLNPEVSFIIPALNEEQHIGQTLGSIRRAMDSLYRYEIIVVDHGSRDRTASIAMAGGATVLSQRGGTIATLRNRGAAHSRGAVLVFLDADVELTSEWKLNFPEALQHLREQPTQITGSHCNAPSDGNWLERYWFRHFAEERNVSHIGTGHLIISRAAFESAGGFDEGLETGEDYEFCRRVVRRGGSVLNNPALEVIHRGFPATIKEFVRREAWHGRGDVRSWSDFRSSRVGIAAALFLLLHLLIPVALLLGAAGRWVMIGALAGIAGLLLASSLFKYGHSPWRVILVNAGIYYFYFLGRGLSVMTGLRKLLSARHDSRQI
ncbi:MAG: glycosyltransferase [Gammaproteobacteria bacterium]|nr:glycosyltransferase [Gammaproteobacteria bacterium]